MSPNRIGKFKDFLATVRTLRKVFERADRPALEKALRSGDFKRACAALHISETRLTALLRRGATEASKIAKADPEIAVTALRQHPANRSRRSGHPLKSPAGVASERRKTR